MTEVATACAKEYHSSSKWQITQVFQIDSCMKQQLPMLYSYHLRAL